MAGHATSLLPGLAAAIALCAVLGFTAIGVVDGLAGLAKGFGLGLVMVAATIGLIASFVWLMHALS